MKSGRLKSKDSWQMIYESNIKISQTHFSIQKCSLILNSFYTSKKFLMSARVCTPLFVAGKFQ